MLQTIRNAWKIADLRKKILYTLMIILIFRIGMAIPVPFMNVQAVTELINNTDGLSYMDMVTGGGLSSGTLFALGISPYITSSIVIQLLAVAIPALEALTKEGPEGQKKVAVITRYTTLGLSLLQSAAYYVLNRNQGGIIYTSGFEGVFSAIVIIASFTGGSMLLVWLGEQIDKKGIGNGISTILFAGIVSRGPSAVIKLFTKETRAAFSNTTIYIVTVALIILIFLFMIFAIVIMTNAERRIPVQYSKRVVGRKMYGGQSSFMPIKVTMSGVMPVIFASSLLSMPSMIKMFVKAPAIAEEPTFLYRALSWFDNGTWIYMVLYVILIIAFNYFYVSIQYNPLEMANNLRKNNGAIPGIRPGQPTADFIGRIISKITLVGAIFIAVICIFPILTGSIANLPINIGLGGTSIIILVGVALDTVKALESQMMMRHYKGFLE